MNLFTAPEVIKNYAAAGKKKTELSVFRMLVLGILAGMFIALGAAVTNTAAHTIADVSTARIICGLLFPAGLSLVILMGGELFTGNCLISISVLEKETTTGMMLKNWLFVYIGNFIGSIIVAAGCAYFGQMNYSGGGLAVFTMKLAATKASLRGQCHSAGILLQCTCLLRCFMQSGSKRCNRKNRWNISPHRFFCNLRF